MSNGKAAQTTIAGYEAAAELFGVLSTPIRLRIIGALCGDEKNVSQLLQEIEVSQPNMSQQLNVLYRAGVVDKRRDGAQMYYRIADETVVRVCKAVCAQVGTDEGTEGREARSK